MQYFYWKTDGFTRALVERSFSSETELEKYIFDNQELLGDIFIIYRQVRTGQRQGIPDMLGVDQDGRVCIVELKNHKANEDILPQALGYAIWAETNPDSIKAIWLESKHKPEDIDIDWDSLDIRVILVAPSFKSTVPRMARKIGYPISLIQIRRYAFEDNEFLLVEEIEEEEQRKAVATKGTTNWDWEYYESEHSKEATAQFKKAVEMIAAIVQKHGWNISYNLNKYYTGFKFGNRVVFSVAWGGTYAWKVKVKLPKKALADFHSSQWELLSYDETFHEAILKPLNPDEPNLGELEALFVMAYRRIASGK